MTSQVDPAYAGQREHACQTCGNRHGGKSAGLLREIADLSLADSPEFRPPEWDDQVRSIIRRARLAASGAAMTTEPRQPATADGVTRWTIHGPVQFWTDPQSGATVVQYVPSQQAEARAKDVASADATTSDGSLREALRQAYEPGLSPQWRSGYLYAERIALAASADVSQSDALRAAAEYARVPEGEQR